MQKPVIRYLHLTPDSDFPALEGLSQFKAVLVVEAEVAEMTMWETSRALVASGCLYALAWGDQCEAWREAIEDASLEASDYDDVAEERQVITTAHEDEDLSEVFWFAKHRAVHPAELRETLILHIADAPRRDDIEAGYRDA
ncbi:hypothetical protein ACEN9F_12660 [Duganella sp. CT11-25]|uniref:DUF7684 family protein n=1 Tax=unclassified Duganella TaxID=2636909 RepID=UPI0039B086D2